MDVLEGTAEFNRGHARATGEIPITVVDGADGLTPDMLRGPNADPYDGRSPVVVLDGPLTDPFDDDTPIVASCDLENPESCESCT